MRTGELPLAGRGLDPVPADPAAAHAGRLLQALGAQADGPGARSLRIESATDSGPVADWAGSGAMALTGRADGPPMVAPGRSATAARAALLALDAVAGRGLGIAGHRLLGERAALTGFGRQAPWSPGGSTRAVATRDGWVACSLARPDDVALLPALVAGDASGPAWEVLAGWASEHTSAEVADRAQLLGLVAAPVPDEPRPSWPPWQIRSSGRRRPGGLPDDLLVVDLSALWAGPLCGALLQRAGARVIRVESTSRPDGGRQGCPPFDDLLHAGQLSVALDFDHPQGRAQLHELVARADIVITSARPRALTQLGLDPAAQLAGRTDGVWVAVTAHPPRPDGQVWAGFGDDAAMSAGLLRRDADGTPFPCGDAIADPLTGMHAALAALAAAAGGGRHELRVSLSEVVASTLGGGPLPDATTGLSGWVVQAEHGVVPVAVPAARAAAGRARPLGADTVMVLAGAS